MPNETPDFFAILHVLAAHRIEFVLVGGVCAVLHGAPVTTFDLDVVHARSDENIDRLLTALQEMEAIYREQPQRRLTPKRSNLDSPGHQLLATKFGPLDVLGVIGLDKGYEELLSHTVELVVDDLKLRLLDLETLISLKEQLGRAKDTAVLAVLRQTLKVSTESDTNGT